MTEDVSLSKQILLTSVRNSAWANRNLLDSCTALTAEELERDLRISHASILSTLRHIYDGERVWLDCLRTSRGSPPPGRLLGLHSFSERPNQVRCNGLQASVFDVQEFVFAIARRSRPQHNFSRRVHQIDGGLVGTLRSEIHSLQNRVGLGRRRHNLQRSVKLAGYLRRQILIEMVLHWLDVNLVDVRKCGRLREAGDAKQCGQNKGSGRNSFTKRHQASTLLETIKNSVFYRQGSKLTSRFGFDWGFLVAGRATVLLLSANAKWIFASRVQGLRALFVFSSLYFFIYLLLRLEDNALLVGAVASFLAVAAVLYFTRKIDWYIRLTPEGHSPPGAQSKGLAAFAGHGRTECSTA
jgi:hypothetical protein